MTYLSNDKQNTLVNQKGNSFDLSNHLIISTTDINDYFTGKGYENLQMKVIINDKTGYRLYCKVKKGNIEHPHYHHGKYELFMIKGIMKYTNVNTNESVILKAGDYYYNPPKIPHKSICLEDAEMFWLYDKEPDCNCLN